MGYTKCDFQHACHCKWDKIDENVAILATRIWINSEKCEKCGSILLIFPTDRNTGYQSRIWEAANTERLISVMDLVKYRTVPRIKLLVAALCSGPDVMNALP